MSRRSSVGDRRSLAVDVVFVAVVEVLMLADIFGCCTDATGSGTTVARAEGCLCCMLLVGVETCSAARSDPADIRRSLDGGEPKLSRCCAGV